MAADDIDVLRNELSEVFDDKPLPPGWDDDWLLIPAPSLEKALPPAFEEFRETLIPEAEEEFRQAGSEGTWRSTASDMASAPYLSHIAGSFPGGPRYNWTQGTYPHRILRRFTSHIIITTAFSRQAGVASISQWRGLVN
jgi:hypothetical protein